MLKEPDLENVHRAALDRVDQSKRSVLYAIIAAAFAEVILLLTFLLLADFSNRLHVLIFVAACLVYVTLGFGLVALGALLNRNTLRVLAAIELLDSNTQEGE